MVYLLIFDFVTRYSWTQCVSILDVSSFRVGPVLDLALYSSHHLASALHVGVLTKYLFHDWSESSAFSVGGSEIKGPPNEWRRMVTLLWQSLGQREGGTMPFPNVLQSASPLNV